MEDKVSFAAYRQDGPAVTEWHQPSFHISAYLNKLLFKDPTLSE